MLPRKDVLCGQARQVEGQEEVDGGRLADRCLPTPKRRQGGPDGRYFNTRQLEVKSDRANRMIESLETVSTNPTAYVTLDSVAKYILYVLYLAGLHAQHRTCQTPYSTIAMEACRRGAAGLCREESRDDGRRPFVIGRDVYNSCKHCTLVLRSACPPPSRAEGRNTYSTLMKAL